MRKPPNRASRQTDQIEQFAHTLGTLPPPLAGNFYAVFPHNALALFYLGAASFAQGDRPEAARRWKELLAQLPPDAPIRDLLQKQIKAAHPEPAVHPSAIGRTMLDDAVQDYKTPLYALLAATGCVLLIACMNVAGLIVARAASRNKELSIRAALGGGRLRLMRERLIESLLLSAAGGALGDAFKDRGEEVRRPRFRPA